CASYPAISTAASKLRSHAPQSEGRSMAGKLDDDDLADNHEINVTPFIDVMLVLLIIFMVAAPLSTVDVPVDLPVASAKPKQRPQKPLFLTVKSDLTLAFGNDTVMRGE